MCRCLALWCCVAQTMWTGACKHVTHPALHQHEPQTPHSMPVCFLPLFATCSKLFVQVCAALEAKPVDIAALSAALRWISMGLTKELDQIREEAAHSFPIAVKAAQSKPFYKSSVQHLRRVSAAIDHRGPSILTTQSRDNPQVLYCII